MCPHPVSAQVHAALERCIQRGMSKLEAVQLLGRLGIAPKFTALGAPAAAAARATPARRLRPRALRCARRPPAARPGASCVLRVSRRQPRPAAAAAAASELLPVLLRTGAGNNPLNQPPVQSAAPR